MSQLHCPHCGGRKLQVATDTQFSASTNVTRRKVTTTVSSQHIRYWCCADCGSTFPFPQDVKQQADALKANAALGKGLSIFLGICGAVLLLLPMPASVRSEGLMIALPIICLALWALGFFWIAPTQFKEAERRYAEYEDLLHRQGKSI